MAKTKKKSKFRGKVSGDVKRQKTQASSYGYLNLPQNVNIFTAEPGGRITLDIMPYVVTADNHPDRNEQFEIALKGDIWYKLPFKIHRNIGANNETVVCPTSFGKKCPICDYRLKLIKEGKDREEYNPLKASLRNLYCVIPLGSKKYEEKPHIWDVSQFLFQNLLNDELEENPDYEIFPDLEEGLSLRIRFDSKTIGTSQPFAEASRIDFKEREHEYEESILDKIPKLDELLNILSFKELETLFFELDDETSPSEEITPMDDDDDEPVITKRRKKKVITAQEEEDEPEEEDETPVMRRKTTQKTGSAPSRKKQSKKPDISGDDDNKCPHGYQFGVDTEKFDECDECDVWDACIDEKEKNE